MPTFHETALTRAIKNNQIDLIKQLLDEDANPDEENNLGQFPLYLAVAKNNPEIVKLLLAKRVNTKATFDQFTARQWAEISKKEQIIKLLPKEHPLPSRTMTTQTWLIKKGIALGFKLKKGGVCHGFGITGLQALLHDKRDTNGKLIQLEKFNQRWQWMQKVSQEKLAKSVKAAFEHRRRLVLLYKNAIASLDYSEINKQFSTLFPEKNHDKYSIEKKKQKIVNANIEMALSQTEKGMLEIPAFYLSIQIHQYYDKHSKLYTLTQPTNNIPNPAIPLTMSKKLEKQGGIVFFGLLSGIYSSADRIDFLKSLRTEFFKKPSLTFPIGLKLSNNGHTISIGYDPILLQWILINANNKEVKYFFTDQEMAGEIKKSFTLKNSSSDVTSFSSMIYVSASHAHELKNSNLLQDWLHTAEMQRIHQEDKAKASIKDNQNNRWEEIAHNNGQTNLKRRLKKQRLPLPIPSVSTTLLTSYLFLGSCFFLLFIHPIGWITLSALIFTALLIVSINVTLLAYTILKERSVIADTKTLNYPIHDNPKLAEYLQKHKNDKRNTSDIMKDLAKIMPEKKCTDRSLDFQDQSFAFNEPTNQSAQLPHSTENPSLNQNDFQKHHHDILVSRKTML
ncbi:MAG: hypothetical protein ACD_46C00731G0002 [uncultured bacterium]|nr:MAG: hypothetical protein ACD_46C00731G0002 [uncultured bacterium]